MINFEPEVYNAKVKYSFLGLGVNYGLWIQLGFDYENGRVSHTKKIKVKDISLTRDLILALDLNSWEELPRKFCRIKVSDNTVVAIGNLIDNRWVELCEN